MINNQEKNRILIFSTAYLPMVGGAEIAVKEITDKLPGWHFDMITAKLQRGLAKKEKIGNIMVYRIGFGCKLDKFIFLPFWGVWKAQKLEQQNNYNLIWSIMASQAGVAASRFKKKVKKDKKMLLTLQEGDLESHLERYVFGNKFLYKVLIRPWHLFPFKQADHIQAISHALEHRALEHGYDKKITVIPNGVDIDKFNAKKLTPELTQELIKELNILPNEKLIFTASRLVYKNGIDNLIKAGQYLDFPFKILIAGVGKDEKKLKKLTKQLNLDDKVIFLGHIKYEELPKYYSIADVFVRASRSEGFGNVFIEALMCGTPVIGTSVGGIVDFLKDKKTGFVIDKNTADMPKEVADSIKSAVFDYNVRGMIEAGKEMIKKEYVWDVIAAQMERLFKVLINSLFET